MGKNVRLTTQKECTTDTGTQNTDKQTLQYCSTYRYGKCCCRTEPLILVVTVGG